MVEIGMGGMLCELFGGHNLSPLAPLLNKEVVGLELGLVENDSSSSPYFLRFTLEDGTQHTVQVVGDCCSTSIFYNISNVEQLIGYTVTDAEVLRWNADESWDVPDCERVLYYSFKIHTDCGYTLIEFRNDSNGYYSGWLIDANNADCLKEYIEKGCKIVWEPLKEDWEYGNRS